MTDATMFAVNAISIGTVDRATNMFAELSANEYCPTLASSRFRKLLRSTYDRENLRHLQSLLQTALRR
jgi:hypothetical protein